MHSKQSALSSTGSKSKLNAFSQNYGPLNFDVRYFKLTLYYKTRGPESVCLYVEATFKKYRVDFLMIYPIEYAVFPGSFLCRIYRYN